MNHPFIAICVPIFDSVAAESFVSFMAMGNGLEDLDIPHTVLVQERMSIALARENLTKRASEIPEVTHALFIDADMTFDTLDVVALLQDNKAIVGGLAFMRRKPFWPAVYTEDGAGKFKVMPNPAKNRILKVRGIGASFLLISRLVLEMGAEQWWSAHPELGEDLSFCREASDKGLDIFCDTHVTPGHVAHITIDETLARRLRHD